MTEQLSGFLPYLLNQAAEVVGQDFQPIYKDRYGMLRTEWRVLFHLGQNGDMTAKQICEQASLHKTKVSRAVVALEQKRFLSRDRVATDRRFETLSITKRGRSAFEDLSRSAIGFEQSIEAVLGQDELSQLKQTLSKLIDQRKAKTLT